MQKTFLSKSTLAAVLCTTKRTLTNYVSAGILPSPEKFGRDAGWGLAALKAAIDGKLSMLPKEKLTLLNSAMMDLEARASATKVVDSFSESACRLPVAMLLSTHQYAESDFRSHALGGIAGVVGQMDIAGGEMRDSVRGSDERSELGKELNFLAENLRLRKAQHSENFIHIHASNQLIADRFMFTSPLFNVSNQNLGRELRVELQLPMENKVVTYKGPELRQDDGLVFMALLHIARDIKLGTPVGFSAKDLCEALWGYYNGDYRLRLQAIIGRLQQGVLVFETFSAQLVQRFDFPSQGNWSVGLDRDIVKFMSSNTVVWLDLARRLSFGSGLASWLYGYVRSQSSLIPTKVATLQGYCGSKGHLKSFREGLRDALSLLVEAQLLETGWYFDEHDRIHWMKKGGK